MDEEKRAAARKIQLALVKSIGLTDDEMEWLSKFEDPDVMEEIRIAVKDGMKVAIAMEVFPLELDPEQAKQVRLEFYQTCRGEAEGKEDLSAIMTYMDEIRNTMEHSFSVLVEEKTDLLIARLNESYAALDTQLQEVKTALQESDVKQKALLTEQTDTRRKLFTRKPSRSQKDQLLQLVEKGRFTPEQLEEITFAINEKLSNDVLLAIAKPELSPEAMRQLRLFYIAKNASAGNSADKGSEWKKDSIPESEIREFEVVTDCEVESEDYG